MSEGDGPNGKPAHDLSDHALGQDVGHVHGPGDHDHDHDIEDGPLESNPIWIADHVSLVSVGMDIGSSGTQVIFSRVKLRRRGEDLTSRYYVVSRETIHESPVALTPYHSDERIDEIALGHIIDEAYEAAGLGPDDIDTGAVILTGEALRRENARAIGAILADQGGDFVCAAAGHHMESMLAAFGSGAAKRSSEEGGRILNVDIGGGTTKLAVVEHGKVQATAAIHVGGRLQVVDADGRIVRLDPAGRRHAAAAGFDWSLGQSIDPADMDAVAEAMAQTLVTALGEGDLPSEVAELFLTERFPLGRLDGVMVSGGVAEYVYRRESRDFGDMGRRLGEALRRRLDAGALPWPLLPAGECIRATALGASQYSVQLSGNTIYVSDRRALLPRKNLQVLKPEFEFGDRIEPDALAEAIRARFVSFDLVEGERDVALAFHWRGAPSYARICAFAKGVAQALPATLARRQPVYVVLDGDLAQTLGAALREEIDDACEVLVIDGVVLWDFDYVDLGRVRLPSNTVPVTVKSLMFNEDPRLLALAHADQHHHDHHHPEHHRHHHGHGHHHHGGPRHPHEKG
jgi:ethanolamine utilization protein EutA